MSTLATFDAFTAARLGIYAAQQGLTVTGNNISNINTVGYTRQRLDQLSFKTGAYDVYRSWYDNHIGSGAMVKNINQIRDPYLDIRFRNMNAQVGYNDTMLSGLRQIASILDEVGLGENASANEHGDGMLYAQIQDFSDKLRAYEANPTAGNSRLVRTSAQILCGLFNSYANDLETLYNETVRQFDSQVDSINECLNSIRDLNKQIRDSEIYGDPALELRDERNRQIDTLSQYLHIKVVYSEEDIGAGRTVEKLSIYLDDDNPDNRVHTDESMLVDGVYGAQLKRTLKANVDKDGNLLDPDKPYLDKDGKPTADPEQAAFDENFLLTISKLVNEKGVEWKNGTTTSKVLTTAELDKLVAASQAAGNTEWTKTPGKKAEFSFSFSSTGWTESEKFQIGNKTYCFYDGTKGAAPSPPEAGIDGYLDVNTYGNDSDALAGFIVNVLKQDSRYAGKYDIAYDPASNEITFTALAEGAVSGSAQPSLSVINDDNNKFTITQTKADPGADTTYTHSGGPVTTTKDGKTTTVEYTQNSSGNWVELTTTLEVTKEVPLDDNDIYGALQATRELLTEKGEFSTNGDVTLDENAAKKRGIQYYQLSLDLLARKFAEEFNKLNQGYKQDKDGYYIKENGEQIMLPAGSPTAAPVKEGELNSEQADALRAWYKAYTKSDAALEDIDANEALNVWLSLKDISEAVPMGGVLFSNNNNGDLTDDPPITAANISISKSWSTNATDIVRTFKELFLDEDGNSMEQTTQNDAVRRMVTLMEKGLIFDPNDLVEGAVSDRLFEGNFSDMFSNMNTILGQDIRESNLYLNTTYTQLIEIDTSRDGVSGVDLNDEAMNMLQFQKAMTAAMRLMTTIDEALDRLINNTGIAGR